MLVGCKTDLRQDVDTLANLNEPVVTEAEGRAMATRMGAYTYVECSAKLMVSRVLGHVCLLHFHFFVCEN